MSKKVEAIPKGFTPRVIVLGLIFSIIMIWLGTDVYFKTGAFVFFNPWPYSHTVGAQIVEAVTFLTFVVVLSSLLGKSFKLSPQEYTVLLTILLLAAMPVGPYIAHWTMNLVIGSHKMGITEYVSKFMPGFWTPPAEVAENYFVSGPTPWGTLLPYLITWIIVWTIWGYFNTSFSLLWRRSFVDIEKLPFPYASVGGEFILMATDSEPPSLMKIKEYTGKAFWIAFVIGFLLYLPLAIRLAVPWFPVPVMKGSAYLRNWWMINFYDELKGIAPWAPWAIWPIPEITALAYLVPIDMLFTVSVMHIFSFYIFPPIEFSLGIAPPPPPGGFSDWYHAYKFYARKVGWKPQTMLETGGIWAFALFSILFHWRYIKNLISYIKQPPEDEATAEPIPYKFMFAFFGVSFILFWAVAAAMGVPVVLAFILVFLTLFFVYTELALRAETGLFIYWNAEPTQLFYMAVGGGLGFWGWPATNSQAAFATGFWAVQFFSYNLSAQPGVVTLDSYKVATTTKTHPKDIFLAQIIFIPIIFALAFFFTAQSEYALGIEKAFKGRPVVSTWTKSWIYNLLTEPLVKHAYWAGPGDVPLFLAAFIIYPIIMFLRMKFPWFILHPLGLILYSGHEAKIFGSFFIALIVKYAVLKIGGTKLYQKGIPIVLGLIGGAALSRIVVALVYYAAGVPAPI